jgi:cell division FtsZ-interacting protein ZapD
MKSRIALTLIATLTCCLTVAHAISEAEITESMEKCDVCKHIAAKHELMKNMTWETHKIDNGMLCVSTVPKEKKSEFDALAKEMTTAIEEVKAAKEQGQEVELCELCEGWAELIKAGAKEKEISLTNGSIHMITSDDPAVVAKIHAEADKAIEIQNQLAQK